MVSSARTVPGLSGVPYRVHKQYSRVLVQLWNTLKVIWQRRKDAAQWRYAEGVWIPKEENSSNIEQFHTISLLSVEGKIFFKIVSQWNSSWGMATQTPQYRKRESQEYLDV